MDMAVSSMKLESLFKGDHVTESLDFPVLPPVQGQRWDDWMGVGLGELGFGSSPATRLLGTAVAALEGLTS